MTNLTLFARKYSWLYSGMVAFVIQRVTGIALLLYLFLHVVTIRKLNNPAEFDEAIMAFRSPLFKMLEIGLLGTVILHALNGIRITLVDLGVGLSRQRQMFWYIAIGVGAIVFIAGAAPIFVHSVWNAE